MRPDLDPRDRRASGLVDVLDRVLDKGLVVAGDIKVSLAEVELLTIRIRLLVCSIDKAEQIGLDWWRHESHFSSGSGAAHQRLADENAALKRQVTLLEERLNTLAPLSSSTKVTTRRTTTAKKKTAPDSTTPATRRRRKST